MALPTPRHHSALPLPYGRMDQLGACKLSRLSADIPAKDKNLIKGVCPKRGILNQITQNFFDSICQNLRNNGITYYSPEHEQYLVELVNRGCTTIKLAVKALDGHVHGGTPQPCSGIEGSEQLSGDVEKENLQ